MILQLFLVCIKCGYEQAGLWHECEMVADVDGDLILIYWTVIVGLGTSVRVIRVFPLDVRT